MPDFSDRSVGPLFDALLAVSTLQAVAAVRHDADERRAGRDPSAQEGEGVVRPYLTAACAELQDAAHRLRAGFAHARLTGDVSPEAALVRRFDALLTLRRLVDLLGTVHRRLLSLYPAVEAALVEAAREQHGASRRLLGTEGAGSTDATREDADVEAFVDAVLAFSLRLEAALAAA